MAKSFSLILASIRRVLRSASVKQGRCGIDTLTRDDAPVRDGAFEGGKNRIGGDVFHDNDFVQSAVIGLGVFRSRWGGRVVIRNAEQTKPLNGIDQVDLGVLQIFLGDSQLMRTSNLVCSIGTVERAWADSLSCFAWRRRCSPINFLSKRFCCFSSSCIAISKLGVIAQSEARSAPSGLFENLASTSFSSGLLASST